MLARAGFAAQKPGHVAEPEDILTHCRDGLASCERPRTIDIVKELPRNKGKLLKRELRDPTGKARREKYDGRS